MKVVFFSREPYEKLLSQQYSLNDIRILNSLFDEVAVKNNLFGVLKEKSDFYFSWWASGSIIPLIVAKLFRKKIFVIIGGNEATLYKDSISNKKVGYSSYSLIKKTIVKFVLRSSTKCLPVSNFLDAEVKKILNIDTEVIHNCIDTHKFKPSFLERKYITMVCNTDRDVAELKRLENFIRACKLVSNKFNDQSFIVIGRKGNNHKYFESLVESLQIKNFVFKDLVNNDEMVDLYNKSKCYVQVSDTETFGVAILEAVSCGTPIVTSKCGAIPEVCGDLPYYCDHNDPKDIALKIIMCINDTKNKSINTDKLHSFVVKNYSIEARKEKIASLLIFENIL